MRIIIIGCGRVGAGLARAMYMRGHAVTVVDNDPEAFERLGPAFKGRTIVGIGFDRDILIQAGIERADALAAVTTSDEANVITARLAKQVFRVPRVAARCYEPRKAEIYRRFGLLTISPVNLGIDRLAELLTFSSFDPVASLGTGEVDILDVEVPRLWIGKTVGEVFVPGEIQVIGITRSGKTMLPGAGSVFKEGDLVHIVVQVAATDRLRQLLG